MPKQFPDPGLVLKTHFDFEQPESRGQNSPSDIADVVVHRTYSNAKLNSNRFSFVVYSDTGKPHDPRVWINRRGKKRFADIVEHFDPVADRPHAYRCTAKFAALTDQFHTIVTRYRWKDAGLLSRDAITQVLSKPTQVYSGYLYERYMEHVFVRCPPTRSPCSIEISVTIPREWAPDDDGGQIVKAYVQDAAGDKSPECDSQLTEAIFDNGQGHFSLNIGESKPGARYYIAWQVRQYPKH